MAWSAPLNFDFEMQEESGVVYYDYRDVQHDFQLKSQDGTLIAEIAPNGEDFGGIFHSGRWWRVERGDFHAPSEHTFAGKHRAIELQLYHVNEDMTDYGVAVSVTFDVAKFDPMQGVPEVQAEVLVTNATIK